MPWHCPNCWFVINHLPTETAPQAGKIYRCPVCRLDLAFDVNKRELVVAPFEPEDTPQRKKTA